MALTESIEYDKIEVVGLYKHIQVRKATVIKKDGNEITRTFDRYVLKCGSLGSDNELVEELDDICYRINKKLEEL